jgi:hypothetical protein
MSRVGDIINSQLPTDSSAFTRIAGVALPLDPFLTGTVRFARKIGDVFAHLFPDNTTSLVVSSITGNTQKILTSEFIPWLKAGCSILVGEEYAKVTEVVGYPRDGDIGASIKTQMILSLEKELQVFHKVGTRITAFGYPILFTKIDDYRVTTQYDPVDFLTDLDGSFTGVVGRTYLRLNGDPIKILSVVYASSLAPVQGVVQGTLPDVLAFTSAPLVSVVVKYTVPQTAAVDTEVSLYDVDVLAINRSEYSLSKVQLVGTDPSTGLMTYQVTFKKDVYLPPESSPYRPDVNTSEAYNAHVRCHPAYSSKNLAIPSIKGTSGKGLGPFAVDWFSGVTVEKMQVEEWCNVQGYNSFFDPILSAVVPNKNHTLYSSPIRTEAVLFWDKLRGSINWDGANVITFADKHPDVPAFQMHTRLTPPFLKDEGEMQEEFASPLWDKFGVKTGVPGAYYVVLSKTPTHIVRTLNLVTGKYTPASLPNLPIPQGDKIVLLNGVEIGALSKVVVTYQYITQATRIGVRYKNTNPFQAISASFQLDPAPSVSVIIPPLGSALVTAPITGQVDRIFLGYFPVQQNALGEWVPGGILTKPVLIQEFTTDSSTLTHMSYDFVFKAISRYRFASSGLIIKPTMLSLDYLKTKLDVNAIADTGKLLL